MEISQKYIKEFVEYNPETGVFVHLRKDRKWFANDLSHFLWNERWAGKQNGTVQAKGNGYRRVRVSINGRQYLAHRVAWIYMTGDRPPRQIDHKDGDGLNNRWSNLRDGTEINQRNKGIQRNNKSGVTGVSWSTLHKKWAVRIWVLESGKRVYKHFGVYKELSAATRIAAQVRLLNGYSDRHGEEKPY